MFSLVRSHELKAAAQVPCLSYLGKYGSCCLSGRCIMTFADARHDDDGGSGGML